jgi:hypothetical protein
VPEPGQALFLPLLEKVSLQILLQGARMAVRQIVTSA